MKHWLTRFSVPEGKRIDAYQEKAIAEFDGQMDAMHREMDIVFTGDADVDMVMGMIPHHQAAVDMSYTLLSYGLNPESAELARGIIVSQQSEIAMMKRWLGRQGIDFEETHAAYMEQNKNKSHHAHH